MGWGDEIMATGQARRLQKVKPIPVAIYDRYGQVRWNDIWSGNPRILPPSAPLPTEFHKLHNGPGLRPYIAAKGVSNWRWNEFKPTPGEIYFQKAELDWADTLESPQIIIEPSIKERASPNKLWPYWPELVRLLLERGLRVAQMGPEGTVPLDGVRLITTPTFRHACAVLARAKAAVLHEGGLHHAAAALWVRAVVIYGGYISPEVTGYAIHRNLFTGTELGCGSRMSCNHCLEAMRKISAEEVFKQLGEIL